MIDWAEDDNEIILVGRFAGESSRDRQIKAEKKKRARIMEKGVKQGKYAKDIFKDLRNAGLTCGLRDVETWTKYYRWKLEQEG